MKTDVVEERFPVDLMRLRTFTEGDTDLEKECIGVFIKQSDENIRVLRKTCVDGKNDMWVEAAHMFKGGAASIGAVLLSKLCGEAQYMPDATAEQRLSLFQKIKQEYLGVTAYLRETGLFDSHPSNPI